MKDTNKATRMVNAINKHKPFNRFIFHAEKKKIFGSWAFEVYELEIDGQNKITLTHYDVMKGFSLIFGCGLMITVNINREPYYYLY